MEKNPEIKGRPDPSELKPNDRRVDERIIRGLGRTAVRGTEKK